MTDKKFTAEYVPESLEQLRELPLEYRQRIIEAIAIFEQIGTEYKNINNLDYDLYEIKPSGVRAYFKYDKERRRIIIIGFICLKKTQKAPKHYMKQAVRNIEGYLNDME